MNSVYLEILSKLRPSENETINNKVFIIDGLNTFIRCHAASPVTSEGGIHLGGMIGFLKSIGYAIKLINPTRCIIAFDGKDGSQRRRKLYPDYKENRRMHVNIINKMYSTKQEEEESMYFQLTTLMKYLSILPVQCISIDKIEADDTIAYLTKYFQEKYNSEITIMSTDKDFYQLVNDKVKIYSPTKKQIYNKQLIEEEFGIDSENFIFYRILDGDTSDNIPGIKGVGLKSLKKYLPILFEKDKRISIEDIFNYVQNNDKFSVLRQIKESQDQIKLNYELMQLQDVDIAGTTKEKIITNINNEIPRLVKYKFIMESSNDMINTLFPNISSWLSLFNRLDLFVAQQSL